MWQTLGERLLDGWTGGQAKRKLIRFPVTDRLCCRVYMIYNALWTLSIYGLGQLRSVCLREVLSNGNGRIGMKKKNRISACVLQGRAKHGIRAEKVSQVSNSEV